MMNVDFFAEANRQKRLETLNSMLPRLNKSVNWEKFRPPLHAAVRTADHSKGGRPPYDEVMMFKVLILQRLYGLSDDQAEYQINDRLSFQRFLGLTLSCKVPDAKTIWLFREQLVKANVMDLLFGLFHNELEGQGLIAHEGVLLDATFVQVPKRHDKGGEKELIAEGEIPEDWSDNKLSQKDLDARWTKKLNQSYFGYKNHVKVDSASKLIADFCVTTANVHDSQVVDFLVDHSDDSVWADSAYIGISFPEGVIPFICERATRNHPLTPEQKSRNKVVSTTRSRVEHVFGQIKMQMGGTFCRTIGMARARFHVTMLNLVYNMSRAEFLTRNTV